MRGVMRSRLGIAIGVAAACSGAIVALVTAGPSASAGGEGGPALLPDLVVESPVDIVVQRKAGTKKTYLRFSHSTANAGIGPLEIYPDLRTERCGEQGKRGRVAYQSVYQDSNESGTFQRDVDTETTDQPVGCMIYHEIHEHYHFDDFARYELYAMRSGRLAKTSEKVSFCVVDSHQYLRRLPGSPPNPYYRFRNCNTDSGIHGISVGWADKYGAGTPGQEFDITGMRPGRYCLVTYADPTDRLSELASGGEDNNMQSVQIRMDGKRASDDGTDVPVLDEPCAPPTP